MSQLLSIPELAHRLGVTKAYVYQLIKARKLGSPLVVQVGTRYKVNPQELERWIASGGHFRAEVIANGSSEEREALASKLETALAKAQGGNDEEV